MLITSVMFNIIVMYSYFFVVNTSFAVSKTC